MVTGWLQEKRGPKIRYREPKLSHKIFLNRGFLAQTDGRCHSYCLKKEYRLDN